MIIKILTLFPEMFYGFLESSIIKRTQDKGLLHIEYINIRDFASNKHKKVDDYPYGGGAGMVMTPQPIFDAYEYAIRDFDKRINTRTIYLTPKGITFNQKTSIDLSLEKQIVFLCGHYEGIDQRVIDTIVTDEISIGDYVLTGGELPVAVMIDAIARLIPGALSSNESYEEESFYSGLLEYPHYTRPEDYNEMKVPKVLLSGNHKEIEKWRRKASLEITLRRRPDIIQENSLTKLDKKLIQEINHEKNTK